TVGTGPGAYETISPAKKPSQAALFQQAAFVNVRFTGPAPIAAETVDAAKPLAPIRVTSPGLTVYKGGAVTPRLYVIQQHLGDLNVTRQAFDVGVSYTPSTSATRDRSTVLTHCLREHRHQWLGLRIRKCNRLG